MRKNQKPMKPPMKWAVMDDKGRLSYLCDTRSEAKESCLYDFETIRRVVVVDAKEWERMKAEAELASNLHAALRDAMTYIDADNLTMQTKHRRWQEVLSGRPFRQGNVVLGGAKP